jgi:hypothetical protein
MEPHFPAILENCIDLAGASNARALDEKDSGVMIDGGLCRLHCAKVDGRFRLAFS